ncbi:hypothetical protein BJ322DRAFT_1031985 [Thelephora terrestris]|uniref:DUF6533 domain-containing protein n=1 Tax=Thelephora terrestris TaxID=56493 RepID=A0A9P6LC09_9AGAM|nr:hypothetical protein BJ322DRAFT_1031985 [Thelephora terrestris]
MSLLTLMVYDWLLVFDREVEHVWRRKWSIGKVLYIISRYGTLLDIPMILVLQTAPYGTLSYDTCSAIYKISTWGTVFGVCISESILLLRTHALYSGSRRVTIPLSILYTVLVVAGLTITYIYLRTISFGPPPSPLFKGCYLTQQGAIIFFDPLLLLVFEFVVLVLTVRKGFRDFRTGTPLMRVVYRDSVSFFLVLFALAVSTIFVVALAPSQYGALVNTATRVFHSIICCRILLNIKQAAAPTNATTAMSVGISFATSPGESSRGETSQGESIQLVGCSSWDDERNLGSEMAGTSSQDRDHPVGAVE